jgi:hypothetical protein
MLSHGQIDGLTVAELRAELNRHGCPSNGLKVALANRLKEWVDQVERPGPVPLGRLATLALLSTQHHLQYELPPPGGQSNAVGLPPGPPVPASVLAIPLGQR